MDNSLEESCVYCGVPMSIHGKTSCGWQSASPIIFPWETSIPASINEQEKRERYLLRNESEEMVKAQITYRTLSNEIYHPFGLNEKEWLEFVMYLTGYKKEQVKKQIENWKRNIKQ